MDTHHLLECQGHLLHQSLKIIDICWDREKSLPCLSDGIDAPFSWHQTSDAIWLIILPDHSESEPPFPLHFHLQWLFSSWQKLWQQGLSAISSHWPTWFSKLYFTFYDPVKSIWIFRYLPTLISLVFWMCCWSRLCLFLSWQRLIPSMTTGESLSER